MTSHHAALLDWIDVAHRSDLGYDQGQRMSFLDLQNHRIRPHSETDCSALVAGVIDLAGYPINLGAPVFTGSLRGKLTAIGWKAVPVRGKSVAQIQALAQHGGEVLINETHHVIAQSRTVGTWLSANIDENGRASGGRAGNQTGGEVSFRPLWMYHAGWDYLLIAPDTGDASSATTPTVQAQALPQQTITLKPDAAKRLQHVLKVAEDGIIGPMTIGAWQARMGTTADRVVSAPSTLVRTVQTYLNHIRDGIVASKKPVAPAWTTLIDDGQWGPKTQAAVEEYLLHWNGGFTR